MFEDFMDEIGKSSPLSSWLVELSEVLLEAGSLSVFCVTSDDNVSMMGVSSSEVVVEVLGVCSFSVGSSEVEMLGVGSTSEGVLEGISD